MNNISCHAGDQTAQNPSSHVFELPEFLLGKNMYATPNLLLDLDRRTNKPSD
jgi:hypothetical protein